MERVLYNRWVLTVICMIAVAALSVAFMGGYLGAGTGTDDAQAAKAAEVRRDRADVALEAWQDESHLIDKTGEEPAPSPAPSISPSVAATPQAAAEPLQPDELDGPAAEDE